MTNFRRQLLLKVFTLSDLAIVSLSFGLVAIGRLHLNPKWSLRDILQIPFRLEHIILFLGLLTIWHNVFSAVGLYESKRLTGRRNELKDVLKAVLIGTATLVVVAMILRIQIITPPFVLCFFLLSATTTVIYRVALRPFLGWVRLHGRNLRRLLIIGTNDRAVRFARSIEGKPDLGYELVGFVDDDWEGRQKFGASGYRVVADCENFPKLLRDHVVDEVIIALPMRSCYSQASQMATQSLEQGILVRTLTNIFDFTSDPNASDLDIDSAVTLGARSIDGWPMLCKQAMDMCVSSVLLAGLSPLFVLVAILIKLDSPGPVFFVQDRVGLSKRKFRMYKFRTMSNGAERLQTQLEALNEADGPVFKIKDDPRITRLGKFLRKTSIDELPQLLNVLKGEMSLVGPRPLPIRDYQGFDQDRARRRFSVRPGLTCLWQVNGRSSLSFREWIELDLHYIDHWSLWLDVKLILKTIPAVLKGVGAA